MKRLPTTGDAAMPLVDRQRDAMTATSSTSFDEVVRSARGFGIQVVADAGGSPARASDDLSLGRMRDSDVGGASMGPILREPATDRASPTGRTIQGALYDEVLQRLVRLPTLGRAM